MVHPQLVVRRDEAGRLLEILDIDVDDARPAGTIAESWMWIEIERDYDDGAAASLDRRSPASCVTCGWRCATGGPCARAR